MANCRSSKSMWWQMVGRQGNGSHCWGFRTVPHEYKREFMDSMTMKSVKKETCTAGCGMLGKMTEFDSPCLSTAISKFLTCSYTQVKYKKVFGMDALWGTMLNGTLDIIARKVRYGIWFRQVPQICLENVRCMTVISSTVLMQAWYFIPTIVFHCTDTFVVSVVYSFCKMPSPFYRYMPWVTSFKKLASFGSLWVTMQKILHALALTSD